MIIIAVELLQRVVRQKKLAINGWFRMDEGNGETRGRKAGLYQIEHTDKVQ